ncbi:hypothetical protein M0534_08745 [Methylonatrum kenyense]|uniref:hypothetical protein n=1 Tax=Methylonatrum kenyense TaxID=455253 RepID=UPI0020BED089|nr:hypothetical protein [Methylonatrum kenyense]MCK8516413.1 hypothetical protein [Methylonatrum kenyense]
MAVARLHVIAPGLLGPVPAEAATSLYSAAAGHAETALLLARAGRPARLGQQAVADRLFALLREPVEAGAPVAPYRALGDGMGIRQRTVFCADPVQLTPDRDQLRILDPGPVHLTESELSWFSALFHRYFADEGLELRCHPSGRWYLLAEHLPKLSVQPAGAIYGQSMRDCLPRGKDAGYWIQLLNAVQMLLHDAPFNQERVASGLPPISGLWFWGGGEMNATVAAEPRFDRVYSDDPLARGLAVSTDLVCEPASAWHTDDPAGNGGQRYLLQTPALPAVEDADSFERWHGALDHWCRLWGPPLLQQLRRGGIRQLLLEVDGRQFRLGPRSLKAFWRRPQDLSQWLLRT